MIVVVIIIISIFIVDVVIIISKVVIVNNSIVCGYMLCLTILAKELVRDSKVNWKLKSCLVSGSCEKINY